MGERPKSGLEEAAERRGGAAFQVRQKGREGFFRFSQKAVVDGAEIFLRGGEVGTPFRDGFLPALATFDHLFE